MTPAMLLTHSARSPLVIAATLARRAYFAIDRQKLAYLNGIEKVNCTICSYANGLIAYVHEVAAHTEQYWCPIQHARAISTPQQRYRVFLDYGDAKGYRRELTGLHHTLQGEVTPTGSHGKRRGNDDRPH